MVSSRLLEMRRNRDYIRQTRNKKKKFEGYASGFELKGVKYLRNLGVKFKYESDSIEYIQAHEYTPDFKLPNGIYVEFKGKFTSMDRKKHQLVRKQHPDLDIRILFMRDNYLYRGSKTRYSDWCIKNGFTFAISSQGEIPLSWINESE